LQKVPELSIFFPFWNEEKNVETVIKKAIPIAKKIAKKWEIIMVDDGSSDGTLRVAEKLAKKYENLRVVHHFPNSFNDGDGQFNFAEIDKFLNKIEDVDIVIGYRDRRIDHPFRHVLMNLLKVWDFIFFRFYYRDIDCGFKLFKKEALKKILPLKSEGAMVTTEILAKAKKHNLKIAQVKVTHYPRQFGDQSGGNPRVIIRAILESFTLWYDLRYGRA
jgi:glycosyltransferase involved in cell wall biosynthesis